MATTALTTAAAAPRDDGYSYFQRLWRLALTSFAASLGLYVLTDVLESTVRIRPSDDELAETLLGPPWAAVALAWPLVAGAVLSALLLRLTLSKPENAARLRLMPLVGVFVVAIALGSFGPGPIGSTAGVGLLPLLAVAWLLPRLPHERPRPPRGVPTVLLMLAVLGPPVLLGVFASVEGAAVGCGSVRCNPRADGTADLTVAVRNSGRLPIVVTAVTATDLAGRTRQVALRRGSSLAAPGPRATLPMVVKPGSEFGVDVAVQVLPRACAGGPIASGAEVRYRVLGIPQTIRVEPVGRWRRGLGCRVKRLTDQPPSR